MFPKVNLNVIDQSQQQATQPLGVVAMAGITERGPIGQAVLCKSVQEYNATYGGFLDPSDSKFPIYAIRALQQGAQVWVSRVEHLTDINDPTTTAALKALGNNGGLYNFDYAVFAFDDGAGTITIRGNVESFVDAGQSHTVVKQAGGTTSLTTASVAYANGYTVITYSAPFTPGDVAVNDRLQWSETLTSTLTVEAKNVGTWGNSLNLEVIPSIADDPTLVDIIVTYTGFPQYNYTYRNFPVNPTASQITAFNEVHPTINILTATNPVTPVPSHALTDGTNDYANIVNADFIGSDLGQTGIRAFDEVGSGEFVKIAVPEVTDNEVDLAVVDYANLRKDCLAVLRTPEGLTGTAAIQYRNATGAYAGGTKIDDWRMVFLYGGVKIANPLDSTEAIEIGWVGDYLGQSATKDQQEGAWFSISGFDYPLPTDIKDIVYNLNNFARLTEAEQVAQAGLYPIIKDTVQGVKRVVSWGYRSGKVDTTSLLSFANVSELLINLSNQINPICRSELFNPNDVTTWKSIYRRVNQIMLAVQAGRGVEAYRYVGDQDVDNINQAQVNTIADIQNGIYKFKLYVTPINSLIQIEADIIATERGALVEDIAFA